MESLLGWFISMLKFDVGTETGVLSCLMLPLGIFWLSNSLAFEDSGYLLKQEVRKNVLVSELDSFLVVVKQSPDNAIYKLKIRRDGTVENTIIAKVLASSSVERKPVPLALLYGFCCLFFGWSVFALTVTLSDKKGEDWARVVLGSVTYMGWMLIIFFVLTHGLDITKIWKK